MKVIHILLGKANPNTMNGVNVVVHNLATAQLEQNIDVEVWGITGTSQNIKHEHSYKLNLFKKNKIPFLIDKDLKNKINSLPFQTILHIHSAFIPEFFTIVKLLKKLNIPYIITPHGAFNESAMKKNKILKFFYFKIFEYHILVNADLLHFIGLTERDYIYKLGITTDNILIPNGAKKISRNILKDKKDKNTIVFLYCGRISIYTKGLDLLFQAFINFKNNGGKGILKFIGDGSDLSILVQKAKESSFIDSFEFLGKQFDNDKFKIFSSSDVFIHTSRHDGMPIAVLEAAEMSLPLLISQETNMGEYVQKYNAGIVLEKNDIKTIEKSLFELENLFNNKELKRYGTNAKKMIDNELNWNTIAQTFKQEYKNILGLVDE